MKKIHTILKSVFSNRFNITCGNDCKRTGERNLYRNGFILWKRFEYAKYHAAIYARHQSLHARRRGG